MPALLWRRQQTTETSETMSETIQKARQDGREDVTELDELEPASDELMAEVDELLAASADMLERIGQDVTEPAPSMVDILRESALADARAIDRVGGQRSTTSNAAAWTMSGQVD